MTPRKDRRNFKCLADDGSVILHSWAIIGSAATLEQEVCQKRLNRGDFARVLIWDECSPGKVWELKKE